VSTKWHCRDLNLRPIDPETNTLTTQPLGLHACSYNIQGADHSVNELPAWTSSISRLNTPTEIGWPRSASSNWVKSAFDDRAFHHSAPAVWNSLPQHLTTDLSNFTTFKRYLKTELYCPAFLQRSICSAAPVFLPYVKDYTCVKNHIIIVIIIIIIIHLWRVEPTPGGWIAKIFEVQEFDWLVV